MSLPTLDEALDELGLDYPRNRKLNCPLHEDSTPSLHLYSDSWYCFACGANGDGIGLVAVFTGQDVRTLVAERVDRRDFDPRRRRKATLKMTRGGAARASRRAFSMLQAWWFGQVHKVYAEAPLWHLLQAIDLWGEFFDELLEEMEDLEPYEKDRKLADVERELHRLIGAEVVEAGRFIGNSLVYKGDV